MAPKPGGEVGGVPEAEGKGEFLDGDGFPQQPGPGRVEPPSFDERAQADANLLLQKLVGAAETQRKTVGQRGAGMIEWE